MTTKSKFSPASNASFTDDLKSIIKLANTRLNTIQAMDEAMSEDETFTDFEPDYDGIELMNRIIADATEALTALSADGNLLTDKLEVIHALAVAGIEHEAEIERIVTEQLAAPSIEHTAEYISKLEAIKSHSMHVLTAANISQSLQENCQAA